LPTGYFEAWQSTEVPPRDEEEEDEHSIAGHWLDEDHGL